MREELTTVVQGRRTVEFTFPDQTSPSRHIEGPRGLPRITRLMALATKFQILIQEGVVQDYADLARLGRVSPARITQIMNLLNLAPDIQERLLFLNIMDGCRAPITERTLRAVARVPHWEEQRKLLARLCEPRGAGHADRIGSDGVEGMQNRKSSERARSGYR